MPISAIVTRCANLGDFCNKLSKKDKTTKTKTTTKTKNYKGKGLFANWNSIGEPWLISIRFWTTKRTKVVNKGWASFVVNLRVLKGICGEVNPLFARLRDPFILALLCSPWPLTRNPLSKWNVWVMLFVIFWWEGWVVGWQFTEINRLSITQSKRRAGKNPEMMKCNYLQKKEKMHTHTPIEGKLQISTNTCRHTLIPSPQEKVCLCRGFLRSCSGCEKKKHIPATRTMRCGKRGFAMFLPFTNLPLSLFVATPGIQSVKLILIPQTLSPSLSLSHSLLLWHR